MPLHIFFILFIIELSNMVIVFPLHLKKIDRSWKNLNNLIADIFAHFLDIIPKNETTTTIISKIFITVAHVNGIKN